MSKPLTAADVRDILTREGVDQSELTITADPAVWTNLDSGEQGTSVRIDGPVEARLKAFHALFHKGLANAPYPDHDEWSY